ncbi:MAG: IS630 family transposase, partial [Terriglobia bacterium]
MWCVAELDRPYVEKMEDVLAVYEKPYDAAEPVVCVDEKPVSLHADVRPSRPRAPGKVTKRDNEYKRCGTANVFCAVEPQAGKHFTWPTPDRSAPEFAKVMRTLIGSYPRARTLHLVMDNLNIHGRKSLTDFYGEKQRGDLWSRLTVHYTPKHGSWLNQAEIEISLYARQCLGKRRIPDFATLQRESRAWNRHVNRARVKINWKFSRSDARQKFAYDKYTFKRSNAYYQTITTPVDAPAALRYKFVASY